MYRDEVVNMMAIFRWSPGFTFMVARTGSYQTMDCRPESHLCIPNLNPSIFNHECSIYKALKQRSRVHCRNNYSRAPVRNASKNVKIPYSHLNDKRDQYCHCQNKVIQTFNKNVRQRKKYGRSSGVRVLTFPVKEQRNRK